MSFYQPDRDAYAAVATHLRDQIISGQLQPGDPIPSGVSLATTLEVSREVAVGALAQLKREGWTERGGRGTRVRRRPEPRNVDMTELDPEVVAEVARLRAEGSRDVEVFESLTPRIPTPEEVAEHGVPAGLPVVVRTREFVAAGRVVSRTETLERGESSTFRYRLPTE